MASQRTKPARALAMAVLNQLDPKRNYAAPILSKLLQQTKEKQRATDLVFGTIRNRAAIDMAIAKLASCPLERIPARLLNIIRIGAYELIYCPATAEYSIVNEAAENAKAIMDKKQVGFVNALLRQISRHIQNRQIPLPEANAQRTIPQTPLTGCEFDTRLLPEPKNSPADYLSSAFSLPKWLVNDWLDEFGTERTRQICFASNRRPGIYLRPNTLKTTTQELAEKLRQADIDSEIVENIIIKLKSPKTVTDLPGFAEGLFNVQDITASQAVRLLEPQPNWTILDLCAAPGTKTTQLAELTGDSAKIIATDIDGERLEKVRENTTRLGISSVIIIPYENLQSLAAEIGPFDAVLLDVPCSNTGVLAKRIEARYRLKPRTITQLAKTQGELLDMAVDMLKPQGKICYSTCSIQSRENGELVKGFLERNHSFKLESEKLTLPSAVPHQLSQRRAPKPAAGNIPRSGAIGAGDCDGGYVAIIADKSQIASRKLQIAEG